MMKVMKEMYPPLCCITVDGGNRPSAIDNDDPSESALLRTGSVIVRGSESNVGGSDCAGTIAGVLYKWTNFHKGWRSRWFTLRNGVLSYSKTRNRTDYSGDDIIMLIGDGELPSTGRRKQRKSAGIVHLKISSFRESRSDDRRFYIFTSTKTLHLRTNSKKERSDWLESLTRTRSLFSRRPVNDSSISPSSEIFVSTEKLKKRLLDEGINEGLVKDCEQIMISEFSDVKGQLKYLCDERSSLLDTLRQFEATNTEAEGSGVNGGEYRLIKTDYRNVSRGKYGEWSATESSDDVEKQEVEEVSDEEEANFFDTHEYFSEPTTSVEDHVIAGSERMRKEDEEEDVVRTEFRRRKKLPDPVEKEKGVSLWSMIKDNVGKDLTRVCLPVYFNEPISSLQKCFEDFEYSYLLDQAYEHGKKGNNLLRILHVAAFAVSGYSSTEGRHCKPFNPLLGETYEADYPEKGVRFLSEKVSHHPTLIACHCEGRGWKFWGDTNLKSKFWGRSIQLDPIGKLTLEFDDGEIFQWSKVTTSIYNLILGKLYCDHHGTMDIRGNRQYSCKLKFKEPSILERNPYQVNGFVEESKSGSKAATLFGKWNESIYYFVNGDLINTKTKDGAILIWERDMPPLNLTRYNLTSFSITLNELTPGLKEKLPPTDSRLRPDQRFLENGEYDKANSEKLRLETRQRMSRKLQEDGWKPRWFKRDGGEDATFCYTGGYWESRNRGIWDGCLDIFGEIIPNLAKTGEDS